MSKGDRGVFRHVLVPVNGVDDAHATMEALDRYDPGEITVTYVIKRTSGPEAVPLSSSEEIARESFEVAREHAPGADSRIVEHEDTAEGIIEAAEKTDASSIAFATRGRDGILSKLFSANVSEKLVDTADRPVLVLPTED